MNNNLPLRALKDIHEVVNSACREVKLDLFVIGAFAQQLWYNEHGNHQYRGTRDIDFYVGVPNEASFERLMEYLEQTWSEALRRDGAHRIILKGGYHVDILPFTNYLVQRSGMDTTEVWTQEPYSVGAAEVKQYGTKNYELDEVRLESATVPSIVALKLFAIDDRPEQRIKDAEDLGRLLHAYGDLEDQHIFAAHWDLLSTEDELSLRQVGYQVLGREIYKVFHSNKKLLARLEDIVGRLRNEQLPGFATFARALEAERTAARMALSSLLLGLRERSG